MRPPGDYRSAFGVLRKRGHKFIPMVSRAYSLFMSRIAPAGTLFIPCRNGYSRLGEYASPEDITRGVRILAETLARLAE